MGAFEFGLILPFHGPEEGAEGAVGAVVFVDGSSVGARSSVGLDVDVLLLLMIGVLILLLLSVVLVYCSCRVWGKDRE